MLSAIVGVGFLGALLYLVLKAERHEVEQWRRHEAAKAQWKKMMEEQR